MLLVGPIQYFCAEVWVNSIVDRFLAETSKSVLFIFDLELVASLNCFGHGLYNRLRPFHRA